MITGLRQEIFNIVDFFKSQSIIDLSSIAEFLSSKGSPKGYSRHALTSAFIVMNCEYFREITLLGNFLHYNLKIA